jgi:parallel beta-helix repeat protein
MFTADTARGRKARRPVSASLNHQTRLRAAASVVRLEALEARRLFAVVTVNSVADTDARDTALTLREAINIVDGTDAYASLTTQEQAQINLTQPLGTNDTIDFNISASGLQTFYPTTQLPAITKAVTIDGYSQPGSTPASNLSVANFKVAIDGVYTDGVPGLEVEAPNVTIDGLMIYRFTGNSEGSGIDLTTGSSNDSIWGNYIGTDGTRTLSNGTGIIVESGSSNNTIGGATADKRNVISGNSNEGIAIFRDPGQSGQVTGNVIEGNYVGTDATGTTAIANRSGIDMSRTDNNTIGGTTPGARNLISGNTDEGVGLNYGADDTVIEGNYIGVNVDGSAALGNGGDGIGDSVAFGNTIGSTVTGGGNVISGNGGNGINANGGPGVVIINNFIGTDASGKKAIANKQDGIVLTGEFSSTVGGTDANTRNIISGNANGIELADSSENSIEGNYIGTDVTGASALGNMGSGIVLDQYADDNTVGGTSAAARNIIAGNSAFGVAIDGANDNFGDKTTGNVVEGNYIGTDVTGKNALGDGNAGVYIDRGADNNTVGGTDPGAGNLISGIAGAGVYISGTFIDYSGGSGQPILTNSNTIAGNYIGTDATGAAPLTYPISSGGQNFGFNGDGIYLDQGAYKNTIGGLTAAARNVIAGNLGDGVHLGDVSNNTVEGNFIGVDLTGETALGNALSGIEIDGSGNVIGGTTAGAGNIISGNGKAGYEFEDAGVLVGGGTMNIVQGNDIGTDAAGASAIGNLGNGVLIDYSGGDNTLGGNLPSAQNVIAYNNLAGVAVQIPGASGGGVGGGYAVGNTVRLNSIFANKGLGIDLNNDGVTPNDPQDPDNGPNGLQNFPVLVSATANASSVTIAGSFNSLPSTNFTLDFYANATVDPHGNSQGKQYLGSLGVITDAGGNALFSATFNVALGSNKYITATATNESTAPYGDTSEFSPAVQATTAIPVATAPTVTAPTVTGISSTGATLGGNVTADGGASITKRGVLYSSTNNSPTLGGSGVSELDDSSASTGIFTDTINGLTPGATYWFVAFATNSAGTSYTSPVSTFQTTAAPVMVTVTPSPSSPTYGQAITFSAKVTGNGTPTGTAAFYLDGSTTAFDTETLVNGQAVSASTSTLSAGSHSIKVVSGGDGSNATSTGSNTFNVGQATAIVSVTPYNVTFDGNSHTATGLATGINGANMNGDLVFTLTAHANAGTYTVDGWSFTDPAGNYVSQSGTITDVINKATATLNVTPYNVSYDANPHTATATATGVGGASLPGADFNLTGTTHTLAGTYSSDNWNFADPNYSSAAGTVTDVISKATATINFSNLSQTYTGSGTFATVTTVPGGLSTVITYSRNGSTVTTPINAGSYAISVTINDPNYTGAASNTLVISKANAVITVTGATVPFDNKSHAATATAVGVESPTPANLTPLLHLSYKNLANSSITNSAPVLAGTYEVFASFDGNVNYNALASYDTGKQVKIASEAATFSNLSGPTINFHTATTTLSGKIAASGSVVPTGNISITLNGVTKTATIQTGGTFAANFNTSSLAAGAYTITYAYEGATNVSAVMATSTLRVTYAISPTNLGTFRAGSTIPAAFTVYDASGQKVKHTVTSATATGIALVSSPNAILPLPAGSSAGGNFTANNSRDEFSLSLKTTGLAAGNYLLYFDISGDPITHSLTFKIMR